MTKPDLRAAIQRSGLLASRRLVLLGLLDLLPETGGARLALHRLCEAAGLPDRTVRRALSDLVALGIVSVRGEAQPGRRNGVIRGHSEFRLTLDALTGQLRLARAALVERLNAAWARCQVRLARRAHMALQRPVTLAGASGIRDISSLSAASAVLSERDLEAKIARERAIWAEIGRMTPSDAAIAMGAMQ